MKLVMSARIHHNAMNQAAGFSLVELLVTLVILSVGVLGVAALQTSSVRASRTAYYRGQAAVLAQQLLGAMRANRAAVVTGAYVTGFADKVPCNAAATVAECDLALWKAALAGRLPAGQGRVSMTGQGMVTICIRWQDAQRQYSIGTLADTCTRALAGHRQYELATVL